MPVRKITGKNFLGELATALGGELVVLGAAVGFGERPLGGDPAALLHAMEGWIERAFLDAEEVVGGALNVEDNPVAVKGAILIERLEDEKVERSLKVVFRHLR